MDHGAGSGGRAARRSIPIRRLVAFVAVLVLFFAAAQEALFRLVFPLPEVDRFGRDAYTLYVPPSLGGSPTPGKTGGGRTRQLLLRVESEPDGYRFDHRLNLYGFRGPTFPIAPPRDRPRVLFIGDSFVEGMGADEADTIPARFAAAVGPDRAEAINLGVSGIGFGQYVRLARDAVHLLRPAHVVLVVFANDFPAPPYAGEADRRPIAARRLAAYRPRAVEVVRRLRRRQPVPRLFPSGPFAYFEPVPAPTNPLTHAPPPPDADPAIVAAIRRGTMNPSLGLQASALPFTLRADYAKEGGVRDHLTAMAGLCRRAGVGLSVVYIPFAAATNAAYIPAMEKLGITPEARSAWRAFRPDDPASRRQQDHLREVTGDLGIPFRDLTDDFVRAERGRGRMFWLYDAHCNAAGYRLAAEACAGLWSAGPRLPHDGAAVPRVARR